MGLFDSNNIKSSPISFSWGGFGVDSLKIKKDSIPNSIFLQTDSAKLVKKETEKEIVYETNDYKKTFEKREGNEIPASMTVENDKSPEKYYKETYDEQGNITSTLIKYIDSSELESVKTELYKNGNPKYELETFRKGEDILTRETFYDKNGNRTIKTVEKDGTIVLEKPDLHDKKIYLGKDIFAKLNVDLYRDVNGKAVVDGNIFENIYDISLEDLHLPQVNDLSKEELANFPDETLIVWVEKDFLEFSKKQVGYFENGKFISFSSERNGINKNEYSLDDEGRPYKLQKSYIGDTVTEYAYSDDGVSGVTTVNGSMIYSTVKDPVKGTETRYYANDGGVPFSRVRKDRKGNLVPEYYNRSTKKWSDKFPQNILVSTMQEEKRKEIPLGTHVRVRPLMDDGPSYDTVEAVKDKIEILGREKVCYVRRYRSKVNDVDVTKVYMILEDGNCGYEVMRQIGNEREYLINGSIYVEDREGKLVKKDSLFHRY